MFVMHRVGRIGSALVVMSAMLICAPAFAQAQEAKDPNPGALTLSGTFDFLNQYMFRGIRQNSTGIAMWPAVDLGISAFSGKGAVKSVGVNFGTWNSLHTGDTGADSAAFGSGCACGKLWYESDFYATVGVGFGGGVAFSTTYTAYTSPNNGFSTVKEVAFKLALDDSAKLGKGAVKPYVVVAQEFDTAPGVGQADGGNNTGTYLELGVAPGYSVPRATIAFPIKVGMSLKDYYELAGTDNRFGYFSVAGIVTVPLGPATNFGSWNIHGGVEYQKLGTTPELFNGGKSNQAIGSFGIGFSY